MENIINSIITLEDNEKYIVLNQGVYENKTYYFVAKVTPDEEDILDEFGLLEEIEIDGKKAVIFVTDKKVIEVLTKYFKPQIEE